MSEFSSTVRRHVSSTLLSVFRAHLRRCCVQNVCLASSSSSSFQVQPRRSPPGAILLQLPCGGARCPMYGNFSIPFWIVSPCISRLHTAPSRTVQYALLGAHAYRVLIGACNSMCVSFFAPKATQRTPDRTTPCTGDRRPRRPRRSPGCSRTV